ncbi:MAG: SRPBCC domain-containing protein [Nevskiales bacterium]
MYRICAETRIAAPAKTVYAVVADLPNYAKWNPWNLRCEGGEVREGAVFTVTVLLNGKTMTVQHKVLKMQPDVNFTWCDMGWFTRFAYGERSRTISPCMDGGNGEVVCQVELSISGPLSWVAHRMYGKAIRQGMALELAGLKQYAEAIAAGHSQQSRG